MFSRTLLFIRCSVGWKEELGQAAVSMLNPVAGHYTTGDRKGFIAALAKNIVPGTCVDKYLYSGEKGKKEDDYGFIPRCNSKIETLKCFPAGVKILKSTGDFVPIENLEVGQLLDDGSGNPTRLLAWLHHDSEPLFSYVEATTVSGKTLRASSDHIVFERNLKSMAMSDLKAHQHSLFDATTKRWSPVHSVGVVHHARGKFAPLTTSGTLVVDGLKVSNFAVVRDPRLEASAGLLFGSSHLLEDPHSRVRANFGGDWFISILRSANWLRYLFEAAVYVAENGLVSKDKFPILPGPSPPCTDQKSLPIAW